MHHDTIHSGAEVCVACYWFAKWREESLCAECLQAYKEERETITQRIITFEETFKRSFYRTDDIVFDEGNDHPDEINSFDVDVSEFRQPTHTENHVNDLIAAMKGDRRSDEMDNTCLEALSGELTDVLHAIDNYENEGGK